MIKASFLAACTFLAAALTSHAQNALTSDPAPDKSAPAAMQAFQLPSHGAQLNALAYIAPGPGPHPVIILLHGFPGNEKNLDVAQTMRRSGWTSSTSTTAAPGARPATSPSRTRSKTRKPPSPTCATPPTPPNSAPTPPASSSSATAWAA